MDTVRIEYMLISADNGVVMNWTTHAGSVQNDPQVYVSRAYSMLNAFSNNRDRVRVRVVSEQTNRIVDIIQ
jgi:DNA polymerase III alpha subunit (gram-positive type)